MASEQGFSNQKKKGKAQFKTIHTLGSDSIGQVNATKGLYDINLTAKTISAVDDIIGIDGQIQFWKITMSSHGAATGDVMRMATGNIVGFEFEIVEVISSSEFTILPISNTKPLATETAKVMRWITSRLDANGNPVISASIAAADTSYLRNGLSQTVTLDTSTPAFNKFFPVTVRDEATGNSIVPKSDGSVGSTLVNTVDSGNSSTTPLGISGVFTGTAFDITNFASISVFVTSNVDSATSGLVVQFSTDGTNWDHSHSTTYTSGGKGYIFNCEGKFARVVFTNGAVAQSYFRLQTIFKPVAVPSSLFTLSQSLSSNMFAPLNRSIISGETTGGGGGYVNVKVNPSGALVTESTLSAGTAAIGSVTVSSSALPSGASTLAEQQTQTTRIGDVTETAPATDTASSGLNGRLQRIAQRLTSLIGLFPTTIGQKAMNASLAVTIASDQSNVSTLNKSQLVPVLYDQVVTTYVGSTTDINTIVYKQGGATVATLTMTYDGSNRLTDITRT